MNDSSSGKAENERDRKDEDGDTAMSLQPMPQQQQQLPQPQTLPQVQAQQPAERRDAQQPNADEEGDIDMKPPTPGTGSPPHTSRRTSEDATASGSKPQPMTD